MTQQTVTPDAIEFRNVGKSFQGVRALHHINLVVKRGQVVVIIGPSGAGKSTLCRTVNRLEVIDEGEIFVDGAPQPSEGKELYKFRTEVGMVFQSYNLFAHKSVLDNVTLAPRKILGVPKAEAEARAIELLDLVGIRARAAARPVQLSGGQAQRAAIARALAMNPKVLLFDEPTSALDPEATQEVLATMQRLADEGITMLVVTHEMSFARSCADRIVFMADGTIVETADPDSFFESPDTDRARAFLSSIR